MEHLLRLLPRRPQPLAVRYGVTTLIVGLCVLLLVGLRGSAGLYGFFVLYPAIFLASVLFDRGSGFYATALSTLALYFLMKPADPSELLRTIFNR